MDSEPLAKKNNSALFRKLDDVFIVLEGFAGVNVAACQVIVLIAKPQAAETTN
jgi:hypothetical protein